MQTIGFRRFLPIFVLLSVVAMAGLYWADIRAHTPPQRGPVGWDPVSINPMGMPDTSGIVMLLIIPPLLPAVLIRIALTYLDETFAMMISLVLATVSIPLFWYLVGRWTDKLLGWLPARNNPSKPTRAIVGLAFFGALIGTGVLLYFALAYGTDYRSRSSWHVADGLAWLIGTAFITGWQLRVWRMRAASARAETAAVEK